MVEKDLELLEQKLLKKNELLDKLHELFDIQSTLLDDDNMEVEVFDGYMDEQDELLQELIALDEETKEVFENLQLEKNSLYDIDATRIECLKTLISQVVDKTNFLQEKEAIKKQKLDAYFESVRKNLGVGRKSSKVALDYYKNMNRSNVIPPQFMDQKK